VAWGAALHAALLAGAMSRSFELALQYANDRSQFGRSMGKFQAVQHQLALMAEHVAAARMAAASAFAFGRTVPVLLNAAIAKARTNEAVIEVAAIAHAIHGAISVTRNMTSNSSPAASMPGVWPTVRKTIGTVSSVNGSLAQQVLRRCTCLPNTRRQARDDDVGRHSSMRRLAMGSVRTPTSVKSRYVRDRE
jgi:alkylation response protein AidB-like acyl-CoA dehydrogenase